MVFVMVVTKNITPNARQDGATETTFRQYLAERNLVCMTGMPDASVSRAQKKGTSAETDVPL